MNMISTVLKRLPKAKTSADFDAALADLETEHARALAAVGELEGKREDLIFTGGDLAALEADISAAEGEAKTLAVAITGAEKRREQAAEAEAQAEMEATGEAARKLTAKLTTALIGFGAAAEQLAGHAESIRGLRAKITEKNNVVRAGNRGDLVVGDPINDLPAVAGRHVADPVRGLVIPEYWPRHPHGPALLNLKP